MKKFNKPELAELNINKTSDIKPPCYEEKSEGTCKYWCNGDNGKRGICSYNGGLCKKESAENSNS